MPESALPPWELALRDAIADQIAYETELNMGIKGIKEPMRGLLDIFNCQPECRERGRIRLTRQLNEDPLNLAARKWLPAEEFNNDQLHVLNLMLWGILEAGITPNYWENADVAAGQVMAMKSCNPAFVMAQLMNPEHPERADKEVSLRAEDILESENAEHAAWLLIEQFVWSIRLSN